MENILKLLFYGISFMPRCITTNEIYARKCFIRLAPGQIPNLT